MTTTSPIVLVDPAEEAIPPKDLDPILTKIMQRISRPEQISTYLKVMLYSEPGVGKTTLAATAPNPLVIDVERGTRVLANKDVDILEFVSIEQVEKVIEYAVKGDPAFVKYDTFVFDSLSEMQRRMLDQQLGKASKAIGTAVYKADWPMYGENTQRLRSLMSRFRDLNKHIVVTAQAKQDKDESSGIVMWRPDLTPKLAATVTGLFDVVGYMRIDSKGERILQVQPSKTIVAKTRVQLPKEIVNPTWATLDV